MVVGVLLLLGSEGVHALSHPEEWSRHAVAHEASGVPEVHAGDCRHRQDVHEHGHACLVCRGGHAQQVLPLAITFVPVSIDGCCRIEARAAEPAPSTNLPGTLGARGPPLMTV